MPVQKTWLPLEGFNADLLARLIERTVLNPALVLPLLLVAQYTSKRHAVAESYKAILRLLKLVCCFGLARWLNGILNRGALNNWQVDTYDRSREVAVVTGGSDGIGKLMVQLLATKTTEVAVLDIQPLRFESTPNVHYYTCDITDPSAVAEAATSIRSTIGHPTILINNAGIGSGRTILSSTEASISKTFAVNILSHFRLVKEFLPDMISHNHGTVVTVASLAALVTPPQVVDYACTKAGALAFHEGLAAELKTRYKAPRVRTICVLPGWTETALTVGVNHPSTGMLKAETVAEAVVEKIVSGTSGLIVLPSVTGWVAWRLRTWPLWLQVWFRNKSGEALRGRGEKEDTKSARKNTNELKETMIDLVEAMK